MSAVTSEIATFVSAVTIIGLVVVRLLVLLPPFFMPFRRQGLLVLLLDDIVTGKRVKRYYDQ